VSVSGGTGAYSYKWSTGATTKDISALAAGSYTLTVTDANACTATITVSVKKKKASQSATIQSFTLLNGERNNVLAKYNPINDQDTINLALLPTRVLNIRANTSNDDIGSIVFGLNGQNKYSLDQTAPYYLVNGTSSWMPQPGTYTLTGTPYSKDDVAGTALTITFYIVDKAVTPPTQYLPVEPILSCVQDNGNGTLTAHFGYINDNKKAITIQSGKDNALSVIPLQGQVIEQFEPGRYEKVFTVVIASNSSLTWSLTGPDGKERKVTVSSATQLCEPVTDGIKPRIVFSPNEDGVDDMWKIENIEKYPDYEITVFNRNGSQVFRTKSYTNNWDGRFQGKPLMPEAYYYVIKNKKENIKTGTVTIIR
jgi:gliding motility-associated-like protein